MSKLRPRGALCGRSAVVASLTVPSSGRLAVSMSAAVAAVAAALAADVAALAAQAPVPAAPGLICAQTDAVTRPVLGKGAPCWTEVAPYPFGSDGSPVDVDSTRCRPRGEDTAVPACYLEVSSLAFRSWNRGLAATPGGTSNAFGVWLWNGVRWFPDPTFPGNRTCVGDTVLWAGKIDYWLVGVGTGNWPSICRFDGSTFLWQPLPIPTATVTRATDPGATSPRFGGLSTGACYSWDNCWFFGTYGSVVRWDGNLLRDASPPLAAPWLAPEWNDAVAVTLGAAAAGQVNGLGLVAGSASGRAATESTPVPAYPDGRPPSQLMTSVGGPWTPTPFEPATDAVTGDPYRTDLVAVDYDPARSIAWTVGVPTGHRSGYLRFGATGPRAPEPASSQAVSPIHVISAFGLQTPCTGPFARAFGYTSSRGALDAYLWSSVAAFPGTGAAVIGGQMQPAAGSAEGRNQGAPEPVVILTGCDGQVYRTRFRGPDPTYASGAPTVARNARGTVRAVAALASNDAWAATSRGGLWGPDYPASANAQLSYQPPRLYRYTDGETSQAPDGDDKENRPLQLREDPPIVVFAPLPPPAPFAPPTVTRSTRTVTLKPAVYAVKASVRRSTLTISFKVRRPVLIGVEAVRKEKVVAQTGLRRLTPGTRKLVLRLRRERWPTGIRFVSDAPAVTLTAPSGRLTGIVTLRATNVSVLRGRKVKEVRYEVSPTGTETWTVVGAASSAPFPLAFDTAGIPSGRYQLRAVITDSSGRSALSKTVTRAIANAAPSATTP
jgi:hypothetical protein